MSRYKNIAITLLSGWALFMTQAVIAAGETADADLNPLRFHVVFNNVPHKPGLETDWGFACLIEGLDKTVLFDTGGNGAVLLSNMQKLGLDAGAVEAVVLSHIHHDHTGGLGALLAHNSDITVYLPESFPLSFRQEILREGAVVETVSGPRQLLDRLHSTGEMGSAVREQALIVDSTAGLIIVTGCAHPDVADMAERAQRYLAKPIYLLMGGFHLGSSSHAQIEAIIARLKALGVNKVAPSHCTGEKATALFRTAWGNDFIEGGLGAVIELPR
jgi:7,8-dihydropterin-6-yl-methyl-4-(beta-D-ribofuranosyl)aminobenzene 5'-phosphate synthase